jgi:ribosomal protein S18 acetylase RimI-like enzyme
MNPITIRNLGPEDAQILERGRDGIFDNPVDPVRAWGFLATRVNEIVVALDQGEVIGFASGTVLMHPDQQTKFFVTGVGVHEDYRRQGVGTRLLGRNSDLARDRGCENIWTVADGENAEVRSFYEAIGGSESGANVAFKWISF